jgi:hypothetical protein
MIGCPMGRFLQVSVTGGSHGQHAHDAHWDLSLWKGLVRRGVIEDSLLSHPKRIRARRRNRHKD